MQQKSARPALASRMTRPQIFRGNNLPAFRNMASTNEQTRPSLPALPHHIRRGNRHVKSEIETRLDFSDPFIAVCNVIRTSFLTPGSALALGKNHTRTIFQSMGQNHHITHPIICWRGSNPMRESTVP